MELLELHLRNIASIIEADIDFTKDLQDGVTGDPASLFLICGDTGAGKSVILDGIAMALYKRTPRITGVTNTQNNKIRGDGGEDVSINDIRQYTRIGISHKDDCYSEVVFRGNDGIDYHARLTLGYKRTRKYSMAVWEVKKGDADWNSRDCKEMILNATGLSFEQFCRMAMLAQGQFATFLKGKKEERTAILEQLTNTERFTTYGKAVTSIYQSAKGARDERKTRYETEAGHRMSAEEVEAYRDEQRVFGKQQRFAEARARQASERLSQLRQLIEHQAMLTKAEAETHQLEAQQQGETYQSALTLIADWESTGDERNHLRALQAAQKAIASAKATSAEQAAQFTRLTADLLDRSDRLQQLRTAINRQAEWLASQKPRIPLYEQAGTIEEQLRQYKSLDDDINAKQARLQKELEKTPRLTTAAEESRQLREKADKAVKAMEADIEAQREKLSGYDLTSINTAINSEKERRNTLTHLEEGIARLTAEKGELDKLAAEIAQDKAALTGLKADRDDKARAYKAASDTYDKIHGQFTTMQHTVDDMVVSLRAKIVKEGIDTCPLCGQHIASQIDTTDFSQILAPWEEKEAAAREARDTALTASKQADKAYDKRSAELEEKEKNNYNRRLKTAQDTEARLEQNASSLGLSLDTTLSQQIAKAVEKSGQAIQQLTERQTAAIALQNRLNQLIEEKKPLDKALRDAEKALTKNEQKVRDNRQETSSLRDQLQERQEKKAETSESLSASLADFYPQWATAPLETKDTLHHDSSDYQQKQRSHDSDSRQAQEQATLLEQIEGARQSLTHSHPEWTSAEEARRLSSTNILQEWQRLSNAAAATDTTLATLTRQAAESSQAIAMSGRTAEELVRIEASGKEYEPAKKLVRDVTDRLTTLRGSTTTLTQQIAAGEERLGHDFPNPQAGVREGEEGTPAYESWLPAFETVKTQADQELSHILTALADIERTLAEQGKINEQVDRYKAELEAAERRLNLWDLMNKYFGGDRFRNLVQTFVLRPLLDIANQYLARITDRYELTCDETNEQLSILVVDRYNKNQVRSATVLSGGETFMISLALSLSLSSLNKQGMNVNILFIDEGFGTLDEKSLDSVMSTLERLQEIASQSHRRVGIISHREELQDRIPVKIRVEKKGEGRSRISIEN